MPFGQLDQLDGLVAAHPETTFVIHPFRNDYVLEGNKFLDRMGIPILSSPSMPTTSRSPNKIKLACSISTKNKAPTRRFGGFVQDFDPI